MTRREWLKQNPPPKPAGPLLDQAQKLEQQGDVAGATKLRSEAVNAPGKCPAHAAVPLYRHANRQEDLYVCSQGPHFLLWTLKNGRAQLVPVDLKDPLPDLYAEI